MAPNITEKSGTVDGNGITQWILQRLMHDLHPYVSLSLVQLLTPECYDRISTAHQHGLPVQCLPPLGDRREQAGARNVVRHRSTELPHARKKKRLGNFDNRRTLFDSRRLQPLKA
ncbi:hypothetical protein D9M68_520620 [compost metagenome]